MGFGYAFKFKNCQNSFEMCLGEGMILGKIKIAYVCKNCSNWNLSEESALEIPLDSSISVCQNCGSKMQRYDSELREEVTDEFLRCNFCKGKMVLYHKFLNT